MRPTRTYVGLGVFLLYCALLAVGGPAMFWSARLGLRVSPRRVQGMVGYFLNADGSAISHVAVPLEQDDEVYLSGAEIPGVVASGMTLEKRRGELAFRFDGAPAEWPLQDSHIALAAGGLLGLGVLSVLIGRSKFPESRWRALAWLGAPGRVLLLALPGLATLVIGVGAAFVRGDLDRVTAVAALGAAVAGLACGYRGGWRRVHERAVLRRARRLAAAGPDSLDCVRGTVRRVGSDFVELAPDGGGDPVQADLNACERLGLGPAPHPPLAVGDRLEVIGRVEEVADPTAERWSRQAALARRLFAPAERPLLIMTAAPAHAA